MDFNATIDLIIRELDEARDIMEDLKKIDGAPVLEIELAKSKIRNAGEVIAFLKDRREGAGSSRKQETVVPAKQNRQPEPPVEHHAPVTESKPVTPEPEKKQVRKEETLEIEPEEEKKDPGKPEQGSEQKPFVAPIIADTFSHLANRFNEQIGENQSEDFSYTHGRHYTSLSDAIGVNDRFYFIRELFDGDREAYNAAVSKLETAGSLPQAKEIIMGFRKNKSDDEAAKHLLELIRRKFSPHE
ncbi:MAG TPA: hypothetical protein VK207_01725 [Bacteroidales bacterium]|nr:hypothetical protein [Bacteroidales bacterium]